MFLGKKSKYFNLLVIALVSVMLFTACGGDSSPTSTNNSSKSTDDSSTSTNSSESNENTQPKVVTMAMPSTWDTLMPLNTGSGYSEAIFDLIYDRLLIIRGDGTYEPRLAESWKVSENSDKVTFYLNKDAKWHDGTPVTADDVVFTFQVAAHPEAKAFKRYRMIYFAGTDEAGEAMPDDLQIKAIDEHTVEFGLKTPMDVEILFALVNRDIYIIPKHILKDIPMDKITTDPYWANPIVGSGPCKFDSTISGERIEMEANKDYHLGAPDFDRFVVKVVQPSNFLGGLMSGEIDVIGGGSFSSMPLKDWDLTKQQPNLSTAPTSSVGYQYMSVNTSKEYLSQSVRQAINISINRQLMIDQLMKGEGEALIGPLSESHKYFNKNMLPIEYDVEKAKKMVQDAGFDSSKELLLLVPKGNEIREKSAPLIQQDLAKIGIKVRIQTMDFPTLLSTVRNGDYDFALIGSAGSLDPDESVGMMTIGHPNNFAHVSDTKLGDIGLRGLQAVKFEDRKAAYDEYQMTLKEQVPFVWLYSQKSLYAYNNRLSNVCFDDFFSNACVWEWKVD